MKQFPRNIDLNSLTGGESAVPPGNARKRALDLSVALALAIPALIVCIAFGVLIRLVDRSPALFVQTRVGQNGVLFDLYKLRTMRSSSPDLPTHEACAKLVTPLGAFLRRSKLDELPQLANVIAGNMSLVGPRPCLPTQLELIGYREQLGVMSLRPGITGVSQLAGLDMSSPEELAKMDSRYNRPWSLRTDIRLIVCTFLGRGSGDAIKFEVTTIDPRNGQDR